MNFKFGKLIKKFFLALGVSLMCWSSFGTSYEGPNTSYEMGNQWCPKFEETEHDYYNKEDYDDEEKIIIDLIYGICLVVKGEQTNNENDVNRGMEILHYHADQQANIVANFIIAQYHFTGGTFKTLSDKNLDIAVHYYSRTLAIIKTYSNYPTRFYAPWERTDHMELLSYYKIPQAYIDMFYFGVTGDYEIRLLNSSSYEEEGLDTYPKYNKNIEAYIDLAIEHARNCRFLPNKPHFKRAKEHREICAMMEEKAMLLKEIQRERHRILSQDKCRDLISCPEIDEFNYELLNTYRSIGEEADRIFGRNQ